MPKSSCTVVLRVRTSRTLPSVILSPLFLSANFRNRNIVFIYLYTLKLDENSKFDDDNILVCVDVSWRTATLR